MISQADRDKVIAIARSWLGTPYRHQASLKNEGCDCLGLIRGVYRELYNSDEPEVPPPYTPMWYETSNKDPLIHAGRRHLIETPIDQRQIGDVLVFRMKPGMSAKHCGILTGEDTMIHGYSRGAVVEGNLGYWWKEKIVGVFQFPEVSE